ncbi:hypothetical protein NLG97_g8258 [Lecanicillium saksenae]|uniref:Uncharacterized protein n=1 Tax=Lecanicillium saksenae TaxID=468837 RepID=A0ACC1QJJ1_9HYPO|nr:hypothetical protein NLG97_g8258 [Lecanicillium saksenae]
MPQPCAERCCGLCTFPFDVSEPIVGIGSRGTTATELQLRGCSPDCIHPNGLATAFHASCYEQARPATNLSYLGAIVRHGLRPERESALADSNHTKNQVAWGLENYYRLPSAVCTEIAQYLLVPYIVASTLSIPRKKASKSKVSLASDIWARFIKVHGRIYIASLSNTNRELRRAKGISVLIYRPSSTKLSYIRIAEDSWGILKIKFFSTVLDAPQSGVWWHTIAIRPAMHHLTATTDGTKLRSAKFEGQFVHTICTTSTDKNQEKLRVWNCVLETRMLLMTPFRINEKGVSGYYVGMDTNLVQVRADVVGQRPATFASKPSFVEPYHRELDWLYFPVQPDDFVCQVWLRTSIKTPRRTALMLRMNSGDEIVMGVHRNEPRTLFLDAGEGLAAVAYSGDRGLIQPLAWLPSRIRKDRYLNTRGLLFYTKTSLRLASEIRLCQDGQRITGLVIHFADKTRGYVGRLDEVKLQRPIRVTEKGIWIRSDLNGGYPFISNVAVTRPENSGGYLHVRWQGILRWWCSRAQCEVRYGGGRTQPAV